MQPPIYLDHHSTTPVDPRVVATMSHALTTYFGNASSEESVHGQLAAEAVKRARRQVARFIDAQPSEVIFTSGATESINLAIRSFCLSKQGGVAKARIALSPVEHKAVLETCSALEAEGLCSLHWLSVDSFGQIDLRELHGYCREGLDLICLMAANNEIGTIYPVEAAVGIATEYGAKILCDATQALSTISMSFAQLGIDYMTLSAHKLYGPKGIGALVVHKGQRLLPQITGGGQEFGLRAGTLNVPAIVGFGEACELLLAEREADRARIEALRDTLEYVILKEFPDAIVNGAADCRLAGNLNIGIPGIINSALIARTRHRLSISTGSACNGGVEKQSYVLSAIGLPDDLANGCVRIGVGKFNTAEEIQMASDLIIDAAKFLQEKLATISP